MLNLQELLKSVTSSTGYPVELVSLHCKYIERVQEVFFYSDICTVPQGGENIYEIITNYMEDIIKLYNCGTLEKCVGPYLLSDVYTCDSEDEEYPNYIPSSMLDMFYALGYTSREMLISETFSNLRSLKGVVKELL